MIAGRRGALLSGVLVGVLALGSALATGARAGAIATTPYRPGVVLIGFRPGTSLALRRRLERAVAARWQRPLSIPVTIRTLAAARALSSRVGTSVAIGVPANGVLSAVRMLRADHGAVRYAEPDYLMRVSAPAGSGMATGSAATRTNGGPAPNLPNDPSLAMQWGSLNTGQAVEGISGTAGADDSAPGAPGR